MNRTNSVFIFLIMMLLVVFLLKGFSCVPDYRDQNRQLDFTKVNPHHLTYQKDNFEVQRQWIKFSFSEVVTGLKAFIYYPVISETIQETENLPNPQWQVEHIETLRKKMSDSLALKMAKAKVRLATDGKYLIISYHYKFSGQV